MKVKVTRKQLQECVEKAIYRVLNEATENINEWVDDDETNDVVDKFLSNPKNRLPKRMKGGAAAKKAAMADIKKETDSEKHDDAAIEAREKAEKPEL